MNLASDSLVISVLATILINFTMKCNWTRISNSHNASMYSVHIHLNSRKLVNQPDNPKYLVMKNMSHMRSPSTSMLSNGYWLISTLDLCMNWNFWIIGRYHLICCETKSEWKIKKVLNSMNNFIEGSTKMFSFHKKP